MPATQQDRGAGLGCEHQHMERGVRAEQEGRDGKLDFSESQHSILKASEHFDWVEADFEFKCSEKGETQVAAESIFLTKDLR